MKNVEDIYPLSPMQELMLLRSLWSADDALIDQGFYRIDGPLNVAQFQASWQRIVDRHPALRTGFLWKDLKRPLQAVREQVTLPFNVVDLTSQSSQEQAVILRELRTGEREKGFDLSRAPLLRVAVVRLNDKLSEVICTNHHLILDRWCIGIIHEELVRRYVGENGSDTTPAPPYRDYIGWIQRQDPGAAQDFWSQQLAGLCDTSSLVVGVSPPNGEKRGSHEDHARELDEQTVLRLRDAARSHRTTLASLFQAAWVLTVHAITHQHDIVFGLTVAGRPADLPAAASTVGSFINNLPMRVDLKDVPTVSELLGHIQDNHVRFRKFEYLAATDLQAWSSLPPHHALFDSLLVCADFVPDPADMDGRLPMRAIPGPIRTAAPITVTLSDAGKQVTLRVSGLRDRTYRAALSDIVELLESHLIAVSTDTGSPLKEVVRQPRAPTAPAAARVTSKDTHPESTCVEGQPPLSSDECERQALRRQLQVEWEDVLAVRVPEYGISFFELGGTSFQAAYLHRRIQALTRKQISLVQLFANPTIKAMAELIQDGRLSPSEEILSEIHSGGDRPPLFCVATPEANAIGYAALARHLHEEQPVYLLQSPLTGQARRQTPEELTEFVDPYVEAMRSVVSEGPFRVVGMCWGAYLAFDVATKLRALGLDVEFVGVLDTWAKYTLQPPTYRSWLAHRANYYASRLQSYRQLPLREGISRMGHALGRKIGRRLEAIWQTSDENPWDEHVLVRPDGGGDQEQFDGRITVFRRPVQPFRRVEDDELGWGQFAHTVEVRQLACMENDYTAILREPHVRDLAERIEECLARS